MSNRWALNPLANLRKSDANGNIPDSCEEKSSCKGRQTVCSNKHLYKRSQLHFRMSACHWTSDQNVKENNAWQKVSTIVNKLWCLLDSSYQRLKSTKPRVPKAINRVLNQVLIIMESSFFKTKVHGSQIFRRFHGNTKVVQIWAQMMVDKDGEWVWMKGKQTKSEFLRNQE